MPAASLARLREQITQLTWRFTRPAEFLQELNALLEQYGTPTFRRASTPAGSPVTPAYHTPPLVMNQLELLLSRSCQESPAAALTLLDALWKESMLEPRLLAAALLGRTPLDAPEEILGRLRAWAVPNEERAALSALLRQGAAGLRRDAPDLWLSVLAEWLESSDTGVQSIGLQALVPLIQEASFENLPLVFRLIAPLMRTAAPQLHQELSAVLTALARRSPVETAYFLRQTLNAASGTPLPRLVRRLLTVFPPEQQAALKSTLSALPPRNTASA